jgi:hypothetical protein
MGGSDGPANIWFEPHAGTFGWFAEDKAELLLWRKVCVNRTTSTGKSYWVTAGAFTLDRRVRVTTRWAFFAGTENSHLPRLPVVVFRG